ncbi:two-component system sensor histidine kinase DesK [Pseudoclavibacter chungangensis]|uniref:sensor histidine kinase n=1 Tax=Pseudoclavibacter chungangensis TaxID=587635 RepID=UPI0017B86CA0|nr:two-component system sensor histidine kinase DesK [Pseudoclavibacter chungangensis]
MGWVIGSFSAASPISFVPFALVGALLIVRMRARRLWLAAFAALVALIGAGAFAFHPFAPVLVVEYLLVPAGGTLFIAGVILVSEQAWLLARRLERAREAEAALAVERERVRFAGDLHDIQGHSLHVIKLKAVLASHLVRTDPVRAEQELGEIRRLADETITHTRTLAYAQHELNPTAEVENAKRLVEAAGIAVTARIEGGTGPSPHPLLAQVLREATTNLLRHAKPNDVTITMGRESVVIANDGVIDAVPEPVALRGLARLRTRVEEAGGSLAIARPPGRFVLTARIPQRPGGRPDGDAA